MFTRAERSVLSAEIASLKAQVGQLQDTVASMADLMSQLLRLSEDTRSLVGPFGVPMPDGHLLVQTVYGTKYLIDARDRVMAPQLIVYRQWEPDLSNLLLKNLSPSSRFVDVGANFGYFSCLAGNVIGRESSGEVFAFEPNPALVSLLRDNIWINWSMAPIHIRPAAVGDRNGQAVISIPPNGAANATLTDKPGNHEKVEVDLVTLDSVIPSGLQIDWMKIDVEGHELAVLEGARDLISRSPNIRIVMEWSIMQMNDAGFSIADAIDMFRKLGMMVMNIPESGYLSDAGAIDFGSLSSIDYANIILTKSAS